MREKVDVLDLIIGVLREHEKNLDRLIEELTRLTIVFRNIADKLCGEESLE